MSWLSSLFGGGSKTKTTSSNTINYDPTALNWYKSNLGVAMPALQSLASNPFGNPFFQANLGMLNKQALASGQNQMNATTSRLQGSGLTDRSGLGQNLLLKAGMGTSALQQSGRFSAMSDANNRQMAALQGLAGFQPLLTGSSGSSTSQTSSSVWPQLFSAALAFGTGGGFGGGSSPSLQPGPALPPTNAAGIPGTLPGWGGTSWTGGGMAGVSNPNFWSLPGMTPRPAPPALPFPTGFIGYGN